MDTITPTLSPKTVDAQADEFYELFYQLSHLARHSMQAALAKYNLTPPQYAVLKSVANHANGCSVTNLADATHQVLPTITGILNRLEERGLVLRRRSPQDRREQIVTLTPSAAEILAEFSRKTRDQLARLLADLSVDERDNLLLSVRALIARFAAAAANPTPEVSSID